tara:strand:- start:617 stop:1210 length:594 start_codon:yes stop_codon:yes gene_type:complete
MSSSKKSNSKESIISTAKKPKSPPPPNSPMNWSSGKSSRRTSVGSTKTPSPSSVKPQNKSFNRKTFLNFIKKQKRKSPPKSSPQESVASAITPLNPREEEMVSRLKKFKISKNNTEIKRNRAVTKFINDPNARERLRVHNEAKKAEKAYAIGHSRRLAQKAGVLQSSSKESGLTRVKKVLFNKSSKNNKNKGSATKK